MSNQQMMDESRAEAVWRRVAPELDPYPEARRAAESRRPPDPPFMRPSPPPEPPRRPTKEIDEPEALAQAIAAERAQAAACRALARRVPPQLRRAVEQLSADAGRAARRLAGVCYLLTGGRCQASPVTAPPAATAAEEISRQYRQSLQSAGRYERWAKSTDDSVLRDTLADLAHAKRRQARAALAVLEELLA